MSNNATNKNNNNKKKIDNTTSCSNTKGVLKNIPDKFAFPVTSTDRNRKEIYSVIEGSNIKYKLKK